MYELMTSKELRDTLIAQRNALVTIMNREANHRKRQLLARVVDGLDMTIHALDDLNRHEHDQ